MPCCAKFTRSSLIMLSFAARRGGSSLCRFACTIERLLDDSEPRQSATTYRSRITRSLLRHKWLVVDEMVMRCP